MSESPLVGKWNYALPPVFAAFGALLGEPWLQGSVQGFMAGVLLCGGNLIGVDYLRRTDRGFDEGLGRNISLLHPYVWLATVAIAGLMALLIWYLRLRFA